MTVGDLLAALKTAGIDLTRIGDDLRIRATLGVNLSLYLEQIREHKAALLKELLQQQIIAAVNVDPPNFDRSVYDHLWVLWQTQEAKKDSTP
jgi:hypothetical protein